MTIVQAGAVNLTALAVPDVYVQIQPPSQNFLNGIPTNTLGIVGTASWGPVNAPTTCSGLADFVPQFGTVQARKYDLATAVWAAQLNGANNLRVVRVTDGTDTAATATIGTGLTVTGRYTGSLGNKLAVAISPGSAANSWKVVVLLPSLTPEVFDNLAPGLTGNAVWVAIAAAINAGASALRGPSQLVTAAPGASTAAPVTGSTPLAGGSDGVTTITGSVLLGQDVAPRRGMYALRSTGVTIAMLVDCDDSTTWTAQAAFGLSEGVYMIGVGPAGDTITNAAASKAAAGIDSYAFKLLFGDWCYFLDTVNSQTRLISPQAFLAGRLSALSPERSGLNKQLYGIIGTQRSTATGGVTVYSAAELQQLAQAGIDLIGNPCPGGAYFGSRIGCNTSSNAVINGDNYPRLTNYVAATLDTGMGLYVGRLQSPSVRAQAGATLNAFLSGLWSAGQIGDVTDAKKQPFSIMIDASNNPAARVALGYMQADVRVTYLSVITKLLINVEAGQSVSITVASSTPQ